MKMQLLRNLCFALKTFVTVDKKNILNNPCLNKSFSNSRRLKTYFNKPLYELRQENEGKSLSPQELNILKDAVEKHGNRWKYISQEYFQLRIKPARLQDNWKRFQVKKDNGSRWKPEEDQILKECVEKYGVGRWTIIGQHLPNKNYNRLRLRWEAISKSRRGPWSPEEDKYLLELVDKYGKKWSKISDILKRPFYVVSKRYNIISWTEEDNLRLHDSIKEHGYNWTKIMENFPDKSLVEVKNYHITHSRTDPNINYGPWLQEEVESLKESVSVRGRKWTEVAKDVGTRTRFQCAAYWRRHLHQPDFISGEIL
ncbi:13188_t:CDS:1 [Acaulospora morrowiae]|uniref:13188_t:CDS:1 n=1 Tax=Acaulospora morrowiae TaxID=94023 RepID=A0A9N9H8P6_9GLOM|nr:13188_t:CDS:1 [Acaulospora morrowiae]